MQNFGEDLRRARESRGTSLEEVSKATRISVRLLEAIEQERFDRLPGGVFRNSFVRQYAQAAGLDEEQIVAEFERLFPPQELNLEEHFGIKPAKNRIKIPVDPATFAEEVTELYRRNRPLVTSVLSAGLALLLATTVYWAWPTESSNDGGSVAARESVGETVMTSLDLPVDGGSRVAGLQVDLKIIEKVWIRATADGKRVWERTFQSGEQKSIEADQSILLLVGNAGGLRLELNGRPMPNIGPRGQVRRVKLTPSGMQVVEPQQASPVDWTTTASLGSSISPGFPAATLARAER